MKERLWILLGYIFLRLPGTFNDIFCEDSPDSSIVPARTIHEWFAVNEAADYPDTDMLNSAIDETDGEIKENGN